MRPTDVLRVVAVRASGIKTTEFRLRPGERGLSLFALAESPGPEDIIRAVRLAGKKGELVAVVFSADELRVLGLRLVRTPGGTQDAAVNALHCEARLPRWRELLIRLTAKGIYNYFNEQFADRLARIARRLE